MKIFQPQAMHQIGKRDNQEDAIFPKLGNATENDRLFIVCDGMGGHESGEVASNSICQSISSALEKADPDTFSVEDFNKALEYAYDNLDKLDQNPDSYRKMGTTLTFLYLGNKKTIIAHIGDSRVYHLRRHKKGTYSIVHRTTDHSLVSDLIRAGVITEEEAKTHPRRNVITRAIQPNLEDRFKATIYETTDVEADDFFFLCSDGVLESVDDRILLSTVESKSSDEEKIESLKNLCNISSRDNNSAYLIHVKEGISTASTNNDNKEIISNKPHMENSSPNNKSKKENISLNSSKESSSSSAMVLIMAVLFIAILGFGIWGAVNFLELNNDTFAQNRKITPEEQNSPFYTGESKPSNSSADSKNEPEYIKALNGDEKADVKYLKDNDKWNKAMLKSAKFKQVFESLANGRLEDVRVAFYGFRNQHLNYYLQAIFSKNITPAKLKNALAIASNGSVIDLKSLNQALIANNYNKPKEDKKAKEKDSSKPKSNNNTESQEAQSNEVTTTPTESTQEVTPAPKTETTPSAEPAPKAKEEPTKPEQPTQPKPQPKPQPEPNNMFD